MKLSTHYCAGSLITPFFTYIAIYFPFLYDIVDTRTVHKTPITRMQYLTDLTNFAAFFVKVDNATLRLSRDVNVAHCESRKIRWIVRIMEVTSTFICYLASLTGVCGNHCGNHSQKVRRWTLWNCWSHPYFICKWKPVIDRPVKKGRGFYTLY